MNPPSFYGSNVEEDHQEFIDKIYKILYAMGLTSSEKAELATYKLKYMAQTWYIQWRDNRPLRGGPVAWEVFKKAFLNKFFPWEKREDNVVELINLHQGGISVFSYPFKVTKLSTYALCLISNPRDEMNRFLMRVLDDLQEECHSTMIHYNMHISCLIVHAQKFEDVRAKRNSRDPQKGNII